MIPTAIRRRSAEPRKGKVGASADAQSVANIAAVPSCRHSVALNDLCGNNPPPDFVMHGRSFPRGFSLVEVVLAIGIVAFALLAIFSLFSSSLQSNKEVIEQVEVLAVNKALPAFLQAQPFATVYGWAKAPQPVTGPPLLYAYTVSAPSGAGGANGTGQTVVFQASDAGLKTGPKAYTNRQGRLFGVYLTVSPNLPIGAAPSPSSGNMPASALPSPAPAPNPPSAAGGYYEGMLALQLRLYPLPQLNAAPVPGSVPALLYDTTVSH